MTPAKREQIDKLFDWFETGGAIALLRAYPDHFKTGTIGYPATASALLDPKQHVLIPVRFEEYMRELQRWVHAAREGNDEMEEYTFNALKLLQTTLSQMIGSDNFEEITEPQSGWRLKDLFNGGKDMGRTLEAYFKAADLGRDQRRRPGGSPGNL